MKKLIQYRESVVALALIAPLSSCAFWQAHKSQLNCAAIASVKNGPELIAIVSGCAAIAATIVAVLPCIEAAAGSQWSSDVVACFAADGAGLVTCPAARTGALRATPANAEAQAKLRAAVEAKYGSQLSP